MRVLEAHNGLSALLVEKSDYDAIWVSSLTHAAAQGLPDNELVSLSERAEFVAEIRALTTKPIIVDIDTGGDVTHLPWLVKRFEVAGAYAVIMEDKKYPKQNSLLEKGKKDLEDIDVFAGKIAVATGAATTLQVFARLESLIAKRSRYEAILRAQAYIGAGANGIMVHSKEKVDATEVMDVGNELRRSHPDLTLVAVPTTYKLPKKHPFNIVIDANHMLRASLAAMTSYIESKKVKLAEVGDIFNIVGK